MNGRRWAVGAILLVTLTAAGCRSWALKGQHQLKITAPATVPRGGEYVFQVEVLGPDGKHAAGLTYAWMIDWPDVRGIPHTGVSLQPQRMAVKGGSGQATLRVYVRDAAGHNSQVDRFEFKVVD
jgi:hypothetical protein